MADLDLKEANLPVQIVGQDETAIVDVILEDGINKLQAKADVTVNSLRAFDPIADWYGWVGTKENTTGVGGAGDIVTWSVPANPDNPTLFPAISVDTTVQAGDDEDDLVNRIVQNLNNNAGFSTYYRARKINDLGPELFVQSKFPGPAYQRLIPNGVSFTATGTTVVTSAQAELKQAQKQTIGTKDPSNPKHVVLAAAGSLQVSEGDISGRLVEFAENLGSSDLRVDGSVTPVEFTINASPDKERFFTSLRFEALGNGIQFTNFLSKNTSLNLNEGILISIRSNNSEVTFPEIRATEDFASFFSRGPSDFDLFDVSGTDYFRATLTFEAPFQLYKQGTFATEDAIKITIRSDLTSGIAQFKFIGFGFERDF